MGKKLVPKTLMSTLGRRFQVGDFYNYRDDSVVKEGSSFWEKSDLAENTRFENKVKAKVYGSYHFSIHFDFSPMPWPLLINDKRYYSKWENLYLNYHLQTSVAAGLIEPLNGSSHYLKDKIKEIGCTSPPTIFYRVQSKKESLNLQCLMKLAISCRYGDDASVFRSLIPANSTHIVVGVIYGAEAYCVHPSDDIVSQAAAKKLLLHMKDDPSLAQFAGEFKQEEKELPVRLYSDLQTETVRKCDISSAYQHFLEMKKMSSEAAAPIAVLLCSLKDIEALVGDPEDVSFRYRDVESCLSSDLWSLRFQLDQFSAEVDSMKTTLPTNQPCNSDFLKKFEDLVVSHKEVFQEHLKEKVVKARKRDLNLPIHLYPDYKLEDEVYLYDSGIESLHLLVDTQLDFLRNQLKIWLSYKQHEFSLEKRMANMNRVTLLTSQDQLKKELVDKKKNAIVLVLSPLDTFNNAILDELTFFFNQCVTRIRQGAIISNREYVTPFSKVKFPHSLAKVETKLEELAAHEEKQVAYQIVYFILLCEKSEGHEKLTSNDSGKTPAMDEASYRVYENGELLIENLSGLTDYRLVNWQKKWHNTRSASRRVLVWF